MNSDRSSIARTLRPASFVGRTGAFVLCGLFVAFTPMAPAAQESSSGPQDLIPGTRPSSRQAPRVESAEGAAPASLATATLESQSDGSRARSAPGAGGAVAVAEIESPRLALIEAATEDAVDRLYEQIAGESAGRGHRVGDLLQALPYSARSKFRSALRSSTQIGGPRFPDVRTTQVQLQARGGDVGQVLVELVTEYSEQSPVTADELKRAIAGWNRQSYYGVGGSVRPEIAELLRPGFTDAEPHAWSAIDADTTRETIVAAHSDAVEQVLDRMRGVVVLDEVPASDGSSAASTEADPDASTPEAEEPEADEGPYTLDKLLKEENVEEGLRTWLADRPIMRLRFDDNREVIIRISVGADDIVAYLARSRGDDGQFSKPVPVSPEQWQIVEHRLAEQLPQTVTGRALVASRLPVDEPQPQLRLANTPPDWARQPITATGTAAGNANRLILGRQARAAARENLRQTLLELPVGEDLTVADLIEQRPDVGELVDRVVSDARLSRTEYPTQSGATVHLSTSGLRFWRLLTR